MKKLILFVALFAVVATAFPQWYRTQDFSRSGYPTQGFSRGGYPTQDYSRGGISNEKQDCYKRCQNTFGFSNSNPRFAGSLVKHCFERTC